MSQITIVGKQAGSKKPLFPDHFLPFTLAENGQTTLRTLIQQVVVDEIAAFRQRQEKRQLFHALTAAEITQGAMMGKIDSGGREMPIQNVDEETAVSTAQQAFEDGLYFVFVDGEQIETLDNPLYLAPNSTVAFVRLVALVGG